MKKITMYYTDVDSSCLQDDYIFTTKADGALLFNNITVKVIVIDDTYLFLSELKNLVEIDILDQMASLNQDLVNLTRALDLKKISN